MKKILLFFLILSGISQGKWLPFIENNSQALPPEIKIVKEDTSGITLEANIFGVDVEEKDGFQTLTIPNYEYNFTQEVGKPKLPVIQIMLAIPDGVEISISSTSTPYSLLPTPYSIYPVPKQVVKTDPEGYNYVAEEFYIDEEFYLDTEFYQQDIWYPTSPSQIPCKIVNISYMRNQRIICLEVYPVQSNPSRKQIKVYPHIKFELKYLHKDGKSTLLHLPPKMPSPFANVLKHRLLNYKPAISKSINLQRTGTVSYITDLKNPSNSADYLIITTNAFYTNEYLKKLADHRAAYNNFDVGVVKVDDIYREFPPGTQTNFPVERTDESIAQFVRYVYNNWSAPSMEDNHFGYVLIFSDFSFSEYGVAYDCVPSYWVGEGWVSISDLWYSYIDENDSFFYPYERWLPEIMIGRLPINTGTETMIVVDKIIEYEKNPEAGIWLDRTILVDGESTSWLNREYIKNDLLIPANFEVTEIIAEEGGTGNDVCDEINKGVLLAIFSGHGINQGMVVHNFTTERIREDLYNGEKLPIILTNSCLTAAFQESDVICMGEEFLRKEGGGGIAYWGAASLTLDEQSFIEEAVEFMVEDNPYKFQIGELVLNGLIRGYSGVYVVPENLLGDPALTTYRIIPETGRSELSIAFEDIHFNPLFSKPHYSTEINVTIHNYGDTNASGVLIKFFLGDPEVSEIEIGSQTIPIIFAEGEEIAKINWTPDEAIGEYKIYVVVDPDNIIPEGSKKNNKAYKPIEVNIYQEGWPTTIPHYLYVTQSPAIGDVNGDGKLEVVVTSNLGFVYIFDYSGKILPGWPKNIGFQPSPPILTDLDNDGDLEIIVGGDKLYVWDYGGNDVPNFPITGTCQFSPAVGNIDGDGDLEIVAGLDNKLYAFHHNSTVVEGWPKEVNIISHPIIANVDNEGRMEVIGVTGDDYESKVYIWRGDGQLLPNWEKTVNGYIRKDAVAVGEFDGTDKELEIVFASEGYYTNLYALNYDGSNVPSWPIELREHYVYFISLGDINNDGDMEIVVSTNQYLYVFNHDGSNLVGWPKGTGSTSIALADIDFDKKLEIIEANEWFDETTKEGTITIWEDDGTFKGVLQMKPSDIKLSPVVIADLDGDGDIEVVCGGVEGEETWYNKIYIWDYKGRCEDGRLEWPMANHDMRRTNCYDTDIISPKKITTIIARNITSHSVDLTWMAVGNDGEIGTATSYEIRYATFTITPQNWQIANKATCTIIPKSAGSQESFTVMDLQPTTRYYFCIMVRDDEFNTSPLSNNAEATTLILGPYISLNKTADKSWISFYGGTVTYTITYTNQGQGTATDVVIIDVLPEKTKLIGIRDSGFGVRYWYNNGWQEEFNDKATKLRWLISKIVPGESGTVSFTVRVK